MDQLEQPTQKNILHWRSIWNKEGREVKQDELPSKNEEESEQDKSPGKNRNGGGKRRKKKNSGKIRRTKTTSLGTKADKDVKVLMTSDDEVLNDLSLTDNQIILGTLKVQCLFTNDLIA